MSEKPKSKSMAKYLEYIRSPRIQPLLFYGSIVSLAVIIINIVGLQLMTTGMYNADSDSNPNSILFFAMLPMLISSYVPIPAVFVISVIAADGLLGRRKIIPLITLAIFLLYFIRMIFLGF